MYSRSIVIVTDRKVTHTTSEVTLTEDASGDVTAWEGPDLLFGIDSCDVAAIGEMLMALRPPREESL